MQEGRGRGRGCPGEQPSQIVEQRAPACRLPAPLGLWSSFDSGKKEGEGKGEERDRNTLPLEPFALKLAGECLRQSLHTEYVKPLGLKNILLFT